MRQRFYACIWYEQYMIQLLKIVILIDADLKLTIYETCGIETIQLSKGAIKFIHQSWLAFRLNANFLFFLNLIFFSFWLLSYFQKSNIWWTINYWQFNVSKLISHFPHDAFALFANKERDTGYDTNLETQNKLWILKLID